MMLLCATQRGHNIVVYACIWQWHEDVLLWHTYKMHCMMYVVHMSVSGMCVFVCISLMMMVGSTLLWPDLTCAEQVTSSHTLLLYT